MGFIRDIVIPVREGDHSPHLALTLRSIEKNFPHGRVWIVGYKPRWVSDKVGYLPVPQRASGYRNVMNNLHAVVDCEDIDPEFWFFNDDFYVVKPVTEPPVYFEGLLYERARRLKGLALGSYTSGAMKTYELLAAAGFESPLNFDLHAPMPMYKLGVADSLRLIESSGQDFWPHLRSVYGAMTGLEAEPGKDYKITSVGGFISEKAIYVSSSARSLNGTLGRQLRHMFPQQSRYEREPGL